MSLAFHIPVLPAPPIEAVRQGHTAAAIRQAVPAVLAGAKQIYRAVLVLGVFAVLLAAVVALRLLIWLPLFHPHV